MSRFRAVIFDLGGVVLGSPLHAIAAYERDLGIPSGFINRVVVDAGPSGGWSRLERGELPLAEFFDVFQEDCRVRGHAISARTMMERIGEGAGPRPTMLRAVRRIRDEGLRAVALTNNWKGEGDGTSVLEPHFDVFIESSVVGLRKPDPRIYHHACAAADVRPEQVIFLDDIGRNLKPARTLGMTTLKVNDPEASLAELEGLLGFSLR